MLLSRTSIDKHCNACATCAFARHSWLDKLFDIIHIDIADLHALILCAESNDTSVVIDNHSKCTAIFQTHS